MVKALKLHEVDEKPTCLIFSSTRSLQGSPGGWGGRSRPHGSNAFPSISSQQLSLSDAQHTDHPRDPRHPVSPQPCGGTRRLWVCGLHGDRGKKNTHSTFVTVVSSMWYLDFTPAARHQWFITRLHSRLCPGSCFVCKTKLNLSCTDGSSNKLIPHIQLKLTCSVGIIVFKKATLKVDRKNTAVVFKWSIHFLCFLSIRGNPVKVVSTITRILRAGSADS